MSMLLAALCALQQTVPAGIAAPPRVERRDPNGFFVDPVNGSDTGEGREKPGWRTLTHALPRVYGGAIIELAPGEYSEASGEHFPLVVSLPGTYIVSEHPLGARIIGPQDASVPVFQAPYGFGGGFVGFEVVTKGVAFDLANVSFGDLSSLEVHAARAVEVRLANDGWSYFGIAGCVFDTEDTAITLTGTIATVDPFLFDLRNSELRAGPGAAIVDLRTGGHGPLRIQSTNNALYGAGAGLRLRPSDPLDLEVAVESCVFHALGNRSGGAPLVVEGAGQLEVEIARSIFWNNYRGIDLPGYDPATYTLEENLVQEPGLVGVGGNVTGDPRFVAPAAGDFHLRADSPARGVAESAGTPLDREFDPRGQLADDERVDLGLDEFFPRYHWFHPRPRPGQTTTLRVLGEPGEIALAFASRLNPHAYIYTYVPPLGIGWQLGVLLSPLPFAVGRIGPDGLAEIPVTFPRGLSDALNEHAILTQVAYRRPQGPAQFSVNAAIVFLTD